MRLCKICFCSTPLICQSGLFEHLIAYSLHVVCLLAIIDTKKMLALRNDSFLLKHTHKRYGSSDNKLSYIIRYGFNPKKRDGPSSM